VSINIFSELQFFINSIPISVKPSPISGEAGKAKGTPSAKY